MKNNYNCFAVIISVLCIMLKPALSNPGFETGTEGEIPTLIKYGDRIPGFSSDTLYVSIPVVEGKSSSQSLIISLNATVYGMAYITTDQGSTRSWAVLTGWWPVNPITWLIATDTSSDDYITLLSPSAGYSFILSHLHDFEISVYINAGAAYGRINKPDMEAYEDNEGDNLKKLRTYEEMKSIDNEYGCRLNAKSKFTWISSGLRYGICAGYTHYIFNQVNFNSFDIGTFVSYTF
jgi:hypothetical protein